ncbi:MAG: DNA replication/repair protein RecF [Flavobacteriales bacterium]
MNTLLLNKLSLVNFKNCRESLVEFHPIANCILGANGQGKTNLLDAIHYLSFCKSYFNPIDSQHILFDEQFFVLQGYFTREELSEEVYCGVKKAARKQFKRNKKEYEKLADHVGLFPVVMVTPYDAELILDGSEVRRRFTDMVISQTNKNYLHDLIQYNRLLQQRNAYLKQAKIQINKALLEIFDYQLIPINESIYQERKQFMVEFLPHFTSVYEQLSGGKEVVSLRYSSQLNDLDIKQIFEQRHEKDMLAGHSTGGVHKDDLEFLLGGQPLKKFGSQGQQKTFLLALKFAQYFYTKEKTGLMPLLLLDDIFDKLDEFRVSSMLELVCGDSFGQVFLTDTDASNAHLILKKLKVEHAVFDVEKGNITKRP